MMVPELPSLSLLLTPPPQAVASETACVLKRILEP